MSDLFLVKSKRLRKRIGQSPVMHGITQAIEAVFYGLILLLSAVLPTSWASAAGNRVMRLAGPRLDKTAVIKYNLGLAFPEKSPEEIHSIIVDIWGNIGSVLAEYPHLRAISRNREGKRIETDIQCNLDAYRNGTRSAIFVGAHLANWEIQAGVASQMGVPISVVYTPIKNRWIDRLLYRQRRAMKCSLISREEGMRPLLRELSAGRSLGLLVDQRFDNGEPVPFFGLEMQATTNPAKLALRFGYDLVPARIERLSGGRFRFTLYEPLKPDESLTDVNDRALQMTRDLNTLFESWIRERPGQWVCTKRRWPKYIPREDWK